MHPNAQPLEEAQRQLNLLLQQQEELAPGLYRDLALYLQVLREGLLPAVQQACFHLATQVVPERYKELPPERRQQFQQRLVVLVRRCSALLTVEQLMGLAAQQTRREQRRRVAQRQRLMQALLDAPADAEPPRPSPEQATPPGSIQLGMDLPVSADLFDAGIPGLARPTSDSAAAPGSPSAPGSPPLEPSPAEAELQLLQSLFQMASAGLAQEPLPAEDQADQPLPPGQPPSATASLRASAMGSATASAGASGPGELALAALDLELPPDPRVTACSLPRDPLLQWSWWSHFDRALSRRLRNLSHAVNVEMMRLGLAQGLLPLNLLDAVLEGQVEALPAPANLLRLPLPLPGGGGVPAAVLTLLLRPGDLEYEQPRLRTCRRRLEQRRRELRTMAGRYRVWQRRVVALEAEQQWFRDSAQHQNPPLPPS